MACLLNPKAPITTSSCGEKFIDKHGWHASVDISFPAFPFATRGGVLSISDSNFDKDQSLSASYTVHICVPDWSTIERQTAQGKHRSVFTFAYFAP
ncbi:hypothetical protein EG328_002950 [Venturia inaequalis]|uniref:Uncharacterized protein n=1 Tax=Venturia inaequalis TaxID=5025 RepID=A0A8H3UU80_VENIN|nr:hypothetical protein EG328_002950 [Venturia inaequalis]